MKLLAKTDHRLRERCIEVTFPNAVVLAAAQEMRTLGVACDGYAVAAPQVGVMQRFFVLCGDHFHMTKAPWLFINPTITGRRGKAVMKEGCLSFPKEYRDVERATILNMTYQDVHGTIFAFNAGGILARVIQHEIDHLDGKLIYDRA